MLYALMLASLLPPTNDSSFNELSMSTNKSERLCSVGDSINILAKSDNTYEVKSISNCSLKIDAFIPSGRRQLILPYGTKVPLDGDEMLGNYEIEATGGDERYQFPVYCGHRAGTEKATAFIIADCSGAGFDSVLMRPDQMTLVKANSSSERDTAYRSEGEVISSVSFFRHLHRPGYEAGLVQHDGAGRWIIKVSDFRFD